MVQERRVGADHQHPVPFDSIALGVQQVGDAMQCHHRLAGARPALDHHYPGMVVPDDLVLLGLDRRDDVAHAVAARRIDRGQQRGIPAFIAGGAAEDLVGEVDDPTSQGVELAAQTHVLRGSGRRDVERARRGRPPIEQQRFVFVVLVENADAADVRTSAGHAVEPAETESAVGDVQPRGLFGQRTHLAVARHESSAVHAVDVGSERGAVPVLHPRALGVESHVQPVDVALLGSKLVVVVLS